MGGKYAVLVGINYKKNPEAALQGCCNDVRIMKRIVESKGFKKENIRILVDDDERHSDPSGAEVKKALQWLCTGRSEDDIIFFHFSGHGTQIPCDGDDYEEDGKDEAIVLEEMFLLADDDLKMFFSQLPAGCKVTAVFDCCHSGGMLDGAVVAISGDKGGAEGGEYGERNFDGEDDYDEEDDADYEVEEEWGSGTSSTSSSSSSSSSSNSSEEDKYYEDEEAEYADEDGDEEYGSRSLPIDTIAHILSGKVGHEVDATGSGVNGALASLFGGTAGKLMMKYALHKLGGGNGNSALSTLAGGGLLSSLLGGGGSGSDSDDDQFGKLNGMLGGMGLEGTEKDDDAPAFRPPTGSTKDVAVLITGCQSHETSADVTPPGGGGSYGALTKTLSDIYFKDRKVTYYDLVTKVRAHLADKEFTQNPCLECCSGKERRRFIC